MFTKDLLIDPLTRGVSNLQHVVHAVASSTSVDRAKQFLVECGIPTASAYGAYEELVKDPMVDVVYVATPVSSYNPDDEMQILIGKTAFSPFQ